MKRLSRSLAVLVFLLANLALLATPADAGRRLSTCVDGDGEGVPCCKICFIFCNACELGEGDSDDDDDEDDN